MTFPCKEECCSAGVDVFADERQRMIDEGVATAAPKWTRKTSSIARR
jgi:hypothetical protein